MAAAAASRLSPLNFQSVGNFFKGDQNFSFEADWYNRPNPEGGIN